METFETIYESIINGQRAQAIAQLKAYMSGGGLAGEFVEYMGDTYGTEKALEIASLIIDRFID